jgi:hypothetical protein
MYRMTLEDYTAAGVGLGLAEGDTVTAGRQPFVVLDVRPCPADEAGGTFAMVSLRKPRGRKTFAGVLKLSGLMLISG